MVLQAFSTSDFIPTRSLQENIKQFCLWDLAQIIGILFIIQIVETIWFLLPLCCHDWAIMDARHLQSIIELYGILFTNTGNFHQLPSFSWIIFLVWSPIDSSRSPVAVLIPSEMISSAVTKRYISDGCVIDRCKSCSCLGVGINSTTSARRSSWI